MKETKKDFNDLSGDNTGSKKQVLFRASKTNFVKSVSA